MTDLKTQNKIGRSTGRVLKVYGMGGVWPQLAGLDVV